MRFILAFVFFSTLSSLALFAQSEPLVLRGLVLDQSSKEPLPFVHISIAGKSVGTVSNGEGRFSLSIDEKYREETLLFSFMGYDPYRLKLSSVNWEKSFVNIPLKAAVVELNSIDIKPTDANEEMRKVLSKIAENYRTAPYLVTGFYRESGKHVEAKLKDLFFAEGVIELSKAQTGPKKLTYDRDKSRIIKGYKRNLPNSVVVNGQTFEIPNFTQGAYLANILDIIRSDEFFFDKDPFKLYQFKSLGRDRYNNRTILIIGFEPQKGKARSAYFLGKLYIDVETHAVVKAEYKMSDATRKLYNEQHKSLDMLYRNYVINYYQYEGQWFLQNARLNQVMLDERSKQSIEVTMDFVSTEIQLRTWTKEEEEQSIKQNENFTSLATLASDDFFKGFNILEREGKKENN
jgi:hypothetical protein